MAESRHRQWQLRRIAAGLCVRCPNQSLVHATLCQSCRDKKRIYNRQYGQRRRGGLQWRPGSLGRIPSNATDSQRAKARKIAYDKKAQPILTRIDALKKKLQVLREQEKTDG